MEDAIDAAVWSKVMNNVIELIGEEDLKEVLHRDVADMKTAIYKGCQTRKKAQKVNGASDLFGSKDRQ